MTAGKSEPTMLARLHGLLDATHRSVRAYLGFWVVVGSALLVGSWYFDPSMFVFFGYLYWFWISIATAGFVRTKSCDGSWTRRGEWMPSARLSFYGTWQTGAASFGRARACG